MNRLIEVSTIALQCQKFALAPSVYTTVLKSTIREEYLEEEKEDKYSVFCF